MKPFTWPAAATLAKRGVFGAEIVQVAVTLPDGLSAIRDREEASDLFASLEAIAELNTLAPDGGIMADNDSQMCDGGSSPLVLVKSEHALMDNCFQLLTWSGQTSFDTEKLNAYTGAVVLDHLRHGWPSLTRLCEPGRIPRLTKIADPPPIPAAPHGTMRNLNCF